MADRGGWVESFAEMRNRAELELKDRNTPWSAAGCSLSEEDAMRALHELSVHQIELEMQNDELQRALAQVESLRASVDLFRTAWQLLPVAAWITDLASGRFLEVNEAFQQFFGYGAEELCDQDSALCLWDDPGNRAQVMTLFEQDETVRDRPAAFRRKDGTTVWMAYSGYTGNAHGRRCLFSSTEAIKEQRLR